MKRIENNNSQNHKMVKHTQTNTNCLRVFDHFVGLALKGLSGENSNLSINKS